MNNLYVVAERWRGDDGVIVDGPLTNDRAGDVADRRRAEADDYEVKIVDKGTLRLLELHGHGLDRLEELENGGE